MGRPLATLDGWGPRCKALRERLGLFAYQMAELLGLDNSRYCSCEKGRYVLPQEAREKVEKMEAKNDATC